MYYKGVSGVVEKDVSKAAHHVSIAAALGRPPALSCLATMYENGEVDGTPDHKKTAELRYRAAIHGHQGCLRWVRYSYTVCQKRKKKKY